MSKAEAVPRRGHDQARLFAALGDTTRLALVQRLLDGDRSIAELSAELPISRQAVRKHLGVLESAGLVGSKSVGREQRFLLSKARIERARAYLDEVAGHWDDALGRLKDFVED